MSSSSKLLSVVGVDLRLGGTRVWFGILGGMESALLGRLTGMSMNGPLAFLLLFFLHSLNSDAMMWHLRGHSVFRKQVVSDLQVSMF